MFPENETFQNAPEADVIVTTARPAPVTRTKKQPPYAVVVENDDLHTFEYVIDVLSRICGYDRQKAFQMALEIHVKGRCTVWSGTLELAELKRDQIREFGPDNYPDKPVTFPLGVYVEPMP